MALQSDGKIVAAGRSHNGNNEDFALVRYNADGSLDTGFGTGGKVTTDIAGGDDYVSAVAVQSDEKIVAAGYGQGGSDEDFVLARYNANGSLDTGFGTGGKVITHIGSGDNRALAVALQSDGKIVAAGYSLGSTFNDFTLVRYDSNGSLDTGFGTGGIVTTNINDEYAGLRHHNRQEDMAG